MSIFLVDEYKEMEPYVPGEQPKDKLYIKLNANETSLPPSPKVFEAISKSEIWNMSYYADPHCHEFRKAVASVYGVTEEEVFVGNGADEVLSFVLMSFFRRGMKIYFPDITYGFYRTYAKTYGLDMEEIPVKDDFSIDINDYMDLEGDIIFANPNNPTGKAIPIADIEKLVKKNPKRMVIVDVAYADYWGETCLPLATKYPNLVVVRTFSKSRNMAGTHIGFAIASKDKLSGVRLKWNDISNYLVDKKYNPLVSLLIDTEIRVCGDNYLIISSLYESNVLDICSKYDEIKKFIKVILEDDYNYAIITEERWNVLKDEYIKNIHDGNKYEVRELNIKKETIKKEKKSDKKDNISSLIDIVGEDIIEYK